MPDITVAILVIYIQIGIVTLGYLVYRRLAGLHGELALQRGRTEIALRSLDSLLGSVNERVSLLERLSRTARPGFRLQAGGLDRRARALEMAGRGATSAEIASALKIRPPEAEFLKKLHIILNRDGTLEAARFR